MSHTRSDRSTLRRFAIGFGLVVLAGAMMPLAAQQSADLLDVLSSEINVSREAATLRLELSDGRTIEMSIRDDAAWVDGSRIGAAARGGPLDRAWRDLLNRGMDVPSANLPRLLADWEATGDVGGRMNQALEAALRPQQQDPAATADVVAADPAPDTVHRLVDRIAELERQVKAAEARAAAEARDVRRAERPARSTSPFRHISRGLAGIFSLLVTYFVLFAIGVAVIFFGGRKYIEGVADTARRAPTRSLLVGLAGAFLVIPAFVLGIIALAISIIGIPALLVWAPGFPLAVGLAGLLGYLGVAHALGEVLAERRFDGADWFQRGNSYYFLLSGIGLLLALFIAGNVVHMAGPWMSGIRGLIMFFGGVGTFVAMAIGFGAVLLSRAGTRPLRPESTLDEHDLFTEEAGV
jgi:hypothetical protein